jgi:hypothetical protein
MPLTDIKIRQAKPADKPVKLADTAGLFLEVKPSGSKLCKRPANPSPSFSVAACASPRRSRR